MNSNTLQKTSVFTKLKHSFLNRLPRSTKRLLFIASVYLDIGSERILSVDELLKLNNALHVAKDPKALELPAALHSVNILSFGDALKDIPERIRGHMEEREYLEHVCRQILEITPEWMFYGRRSGTKDTDMISDLLVMFKLHPSISAA